MKFLLINGSKAKQETAQLVINEAKKYFDTVLSLPLNKIRIECVDGKTRLLYKDTDLRKFDVCYPRFFAEDFLFGQIVLDILWSSRTYLPNCPESFEVANNKYMTVQLLSEIDVPLPATALSVSQKSAMEISEKLGFPIVVKLISGFGGKGVMRMQSMQEFKPVLDTLVVFEEFLCTQEFVDGQGKDLRCYVIGDDVLAVRRYAAAGEWRSNISRGGRAELTSLPKQYKEIVLKSAKVLGMELATVDIVETKHGPRVIEANFCPGLILRFFGRKFVKAFVKFFYKKAKERETIE